MQSPGSRRHLILAATLAALAVFCGGVWWLATRSDTCSFLTAHSGAEWIVDAKPLDNVVHAAVPWHTTFRRAVICQSAPAQATVEIRALRTASFTVNGQTVNGLAADDRHWKSATRLDIASLLHAGTNELVVTVTNQFGPPALWLRLQAGAIAIGTDADWEASPVNAAWLNAHIATEPLPIPAWNKFFSPFHTPTSLALIWLRLLVLTLVALIVVLGGIFLGRRMPQPRIDWVCFVFTAIVIARVTLFCVDQPGLLRTMGFDASAHEDYIRFIQEKHALPLPNDGWEMHQPPLYYLLSAGVLHVLGLTAGDANAVVPLRAINCFISVANLWLVLLCLRRLFPQNFSAQAIGLIVAGFLPANLYPSFYVTNEPLAGLLVTLAFYLFLRQKLEEDFNPRLALGIGLALGAAVLTKMTTLVVLPVFLGALVIHAMGRPRAALRSSLVNVALVLVAFTLACGWHYFRVWTQIHALPLPNSQTDPANAWWQDPGIRTTGYYLRFGQALTSPVFSGVNSFWDGLYSTLWGDSLISGCGEMMYRPPWDYDLMNGALLLGAAMSLLALLGFAIYLAKFLREPDAVSGLFPGAILTFIAAILLLTLRGPWLAHVKAFYALPALVPFCALLVTGWLRLAQRGAVARIALWTVVLSWAFTTVGSFWINANKYEAWRNTAILQEQTGDLKDAVVNINRALQLNPTDANSHLVLAAAYVDQNDVADAIPEYVRTLQLDPDKIPALTTLASLLANGQPDDVERAIHIANHACELTAYRDSSSVNTLADILVKGKKWDDARATAQIACELARQEGDGPLLRKNQALLESIRTNSVAPVK